MTQNTVSRDVLRIIEEVRSEHQAKLKRPSRYMGIRSNRSRRKPYVYVGTVRKLTSEEIEELQACVERLRNPSLRIEPIVRRNVV